MLSEPLTSLLRYAPVTVFRPYIHVTLKHSPLNHHMVIRPCHALACSGSRPVMLSRAWPSPCDITLTYIVASPCHNAASPCHDAASPCHDAASPCHDAASHCHDAASHCHDAASHSHDAASHSHNAASHSHNAASHSHNAASHSHNAASHSHNVASNCNNMTAHCHYSSCAFPRSCTTIATAVMSANICKYGAGATQHG